MHGGVAEWTMAAVLKTANRLWWFVGSNPTPSAIAPHRQVYRQ